MTNTEYHALMRSKRPPLSPKMQDVKDRLFVEAKAVFGQAVALDSHDAPHGFPGDNQVIVLYISREPGVMQVSATVSARELEVIPIPYIVRGMIDRAVHHLRASV